jgi:hypothetical protein
MLRACTNCNRPFTVQDFVKEESKGMEEDRKALGLEGVQFLYYRCPACDQADIFIDLRRLAGESEELFRARRAGLEAAIRQVQSERTAVVLKETGSSRPGG